MKKNNSLFLLFTIILIEGYVVLATELLAIRQTIPFIGSGTDTVAIIIAAVLMPLAFGYEYGGYFRPHRIAGIHMTVRKKLIYNILWASTILLFGMTYWFLEVFFYVLSDIGITNRLVQASIYCLIFIVTPVFLLGQTVPLITNFFGREKLSQITGKILFFSTMGSFAGATFSTLVLMPNLGVHHTVSLNFILLSILVILLSKDLKDNRVAYMLFITSCALVFNSNNLMHSMGIVNNNGYNTAAVVYPNAKDNPRVLLLNGTFSSMMDDKSKKIEYVNMIEDIVINPTLHDNSSPKDFLIIGAGGFTIGSEDTKNNYTFLDIDKDLKDIAEKYILEKKLEPNKKFLSVPARAFLRQENKKYDFILLDAYLGGLSLPEQLVTREFFTEVKAHLKDKGLMIANFIAPSNFNSRYSRNIDNTLRSVFPHISRQPVERKNYALYSDDPDKINNIAYIYRHEDNYDMGDIYTDDKNTVFYDKPKRVQH